MKTMTALLAGTIVAATMATAPASAQSITIGPDGPGIDLRSRGQRERDYRREMRARDMDRDDYYREQRFRDPDRSYRRSYGY